MKVTRTRKFALIAAVVMIGLAIVWYQFGGHRTAAGQRPMAVLDARSLEQFRADFNAAASDTRIILLLSPT